MVLKGFRAEAGNHVRAYGAVRDEFADLRHAVEIPLAGVTAPHFLKYAVGAGLDREMDVVADVRVARHSLDNLIADVLRVGSGETHAQQRVHLGHEREQLGKGRTFIVI